MPFILSGLTTFLLGSQVHKVLQYMLDLKVPVSLLHQHEIIMQQQVSDISAIQSQCADLITPSFFMMQIQTL